jgi:ankyrin repeat protein
MTDRSDFGVAVTFLDSDDIDGLQYLLKAQPDLASARDDDNSTLLIRLIDWPGHRPRASETARVLLNAGAEIDARRNDENGTPLCGALCTEVADVIRAR